MTNKGTKMGSDAARRIQSSQDKKGQSGDAGVQEQVDELVCQERQEVEVHESIPGSIFSSFSPAVHPRNDHHHVAGHHRGVELVRRGPRRRLDALAPGAASTAGTQGRSSEARASCRGDKQAARAARALAAIQGEPCLPQEILATSEVIF
jgi:hypothetical protein